MDRGSEKEHEGQNRHLLLVEFLQSRVQNRKQNEQQGVHIEIPELFAPDREDHVMVIHSRRDKPLDRRTDVQPHIQEQIVKRLHDGDAVIEEQEHRNAPEHAQRPEPHPPLHFEARIQPDEARDQRKQIDGAVRRRFERPGHRVVYRVLCRDDARPRVGVDRALTENVQL